MGAGSLVASGAFESITAERDVSVSVVGDGSGFLALRPGTLEEGSPYATTRDGKLALTIDENADVTGAGVNPGAVTDLGGVFTVVNQGGEPVAIWLSDESDAVSFSSDGASLEGENAAVTIEPGQHVTVDVTIDTTGEVDTEETLLESMTVHASAENADSSPGGGGGSEDETPPAISNFAASADGADVTVSFDSDEQLAGATVDVASSGSVVSSLSLGDLTESSADGTYTYEGTVTVSADGEYSVTLTSATDAAGNDGASGQSATVTVSTGGGDGGSGLQTFTTSGTTANYSGVDDGAAPFTIECDGMVENSFKENRDDYGVVYVDDALGETGSVVVRVDSLANSHWLAQAGIMVRNDVTKPGESLGYAPLFVKTQGTNDYVLAADEDGDGYAKWSNADKRAGGANTFPSWLKLEKDGTTFTGYCKKAEGDSWTEIYSAELSSANKTQDVGVFATSGRTSDLGKAEFGEFLIDGSAVGSDSGSGSDTSGTTLSTVDTTSAGATFSGVDDGDGAFSIEATGVRRGNGEYAAVTPDLTIGPGDSVEVKVESLSSGYFKAEGGIMIRDDLTDSGSQGGALVAARQDDLLVKGSDGSGSGTIGIGGASAGQPGTPIWLRINRSEQDNGTNVYEMQYKTSVDGTYSNVATEKIAQPYCSDEQDVGVYVTSESSSESVAAEFSGFALNGGN